MKKLKTRVLLLFFSFIHLPIVGLAQENLAPLKLNPLLYSNTAISSPVQYKITSLNLPFFEDFTDYSLYPNPLRWMDSEVYINNTMCINPISRGVATFDALNKIGRPYDTLNPFNLLYADSLTSQPINLGSFAPKDSIYLSFFYQAQGRGFSPETSDSFELYFLKKNGEWNLIWSAMGTDVKPFQQVMIPVTDTNYLFSLFQFRFVNKASINTNDDVWNLDYIRMAANRNQYDTSIRDLAYTSPPANYLNDYTSMPYRQFLANVAGERAANQADTIWNHYGTNGTVNYGFRAVETLTGTPLGSGNNTNTILAFNKQEISFPTVSTLVSPPSNKSRIVYQNKYFLQSGNPNEPKDNDSIISEQVFDNYLAYDDGSAEKSYFLNLSSSLPGKIAIEFHLNTPDTLRGIAIYFGQQVPTAASKEFSVALYSKLAGISGANADIKLYQQDLLYPVMTNQVNGFTVYRFDSPIQLPAGVFYIGTIQPASSGSDSLYFGLDANRVSGNHAYFNVLNAWQGSLVNGAIMMRPLLGGPVTGTSVQDAPLNETGWSLYPNPCQNSLNISAGFIPSDYLINDIQGRIVLTRPYGKKPIDVSTLSSGLYTLRLRKQDIWGAPLLFIKQ